MDTILWMFRTQDPFALALTVIFGLVINLILFNIDFITLAFRKAYLAIKGDSFVPHRFGELPSGLIVIPSLLRNEEDYQGIIGTLQSCSNNNYPNNLIIIVSVDGNKENPELYQRLIDWMNNYQHPDNIRLHITYNDKRLSKMMAIETGVNHMHQLIKEGKYDSFPPIYFSIDADGTLSEHALERLATKLTTRHWITGNYRKVVAGNPMVPTTEVFKDWKEFFTVRGQNNINIARQFLLANLHRANLSPVPFIALPGAIYTTWSQVIINAPKITGYLQTIGFMDWVKWWLGKPLPKISEVNAEPLPEALTGSTDDTSIGIVASLSWWKDGKLEFDAPRSPIHAFGRMLREWFIERSHGHDMHARAYTFTPPTMRGLWLQRIRWNSSRVEVSGRFSKAFLFWWECGSAFLTTLARILANLFYTIVIYCVVPFFFMVGSNHIMYGIIFGYFFNMFCTSLYVVIACAITPESRAYLKVLYAAPIAWIYTLCFEFGPAAVGVVKDIFFFGTNVRFCPEWTLIKGKSSRVAVLFRIRRFISMCFRSVVYGDVPFGSWWFGWREHEPYVKSGYHGWTSGKRASYNLK